MSAPTATYVYCVASAAEAPPAPPELEGLPGAGAVACLPLAPSLWVVVSEVPVASYSQEQIEAGLGDLDWVSPRALAHERVVEHFATVVGADVVPMKLFTLFTSPQRAVESLRAREPELRASVSRIAGAEEWGLRIFFDPQAARARVRRDSPARATSGAAFLQQKRALRDAAQEGLREALRRAEAVYGALTPQVREARTLQPKAAGAEGARVPVLEAAFLVPKAERARFEQAADAALRGFEPDLFDITLSGPWPAYNFIGG